ncbi:hypothetical protein OSTOST_18198 [Ostertagia ostertagi]
MLLLLLILLPVTVADSFWMTAELLRVDWREGCLTTAGCSQPRFKILQDMLPLTEKVSISWPVSEHFVQDSARPFVSHWTNGKPEDVTMSCQVVGTDPTYGFPTSLRPNPVDSRVPRAYHRGICGEFETFRFPGRNRRHQSTTQTPLSEEDLGKKLIEIRGKCFNATVWPYKKHTESLSCCVGSLGRDSDRTKGVHPLLNPITLPDEPSVLSASILSHLRGDDRILHVSVLVLAGIAILASIGFACVLVAFLRQKRYDMPWEQTRPLTYWMSSSSKSEATTTSPLDSASSLGAQSSIVAPYSFRSGCTIPQTHLYHHISPNSSIGPGHDSGLESV